MKNNYFIKKIFSSTTATLILAVNCFFATVNLCNAGFDFSVIDSSGPTSAWGKAVGDVDSDGKIDLLVGGKEVNSGLFWYKNPSWQKNAIDTTAQISTDIEVVDINGDGRKDVVTINFNPSIRTLWYENTGSGWTPHTIATDTVHDIEIADFDSDGKLDVVARNQGSSGNILYFYKQNTLTSWTRSTLTLPEQGEGIKISDIDRDGKLDIVVPKYWFKNSGSIASWTRYEFSSGAYANGYIDTGDINGDGRVDIVISPSEYAGQYSKVACYLAPENPQVSWTEKIIESNVEAVHHFVGIADFNRDGKPDVATAMMQQGTNPKVKVYYNKDGQGNFDPPTILADTSSHSMKIFDMEGKYAPSIFGADYARNPTPVQLWKNNTSSIGTDKWTYHQIDNIRTGQYFGLSMSDWTGDGKKDIASGKYFYRNPGGDMTSAWPRTTFPINVDALLAVEVDGDVYGDIIAMDGTGKLYWLEETARDGSSWSYIQVGNLGIADHSVSSQGYTAANIVPDEKSEIILTSPTGKHYFKIPSNPTAGNWPMTTISSETADPEGIAAGDIDRDGNVDVCGLIGGKTLAWWKNPGLAGGTWAKYTIGSLSYDYVDRVYLADLNNDGKLDAAASAANGGNNGVYWFQAPSDPQGAWTVRTVINYGSSNSVNSLDVADIDFDGDKDIIAATHMDTLKVSIWANDGTGSFSERIIDTGHESHLGARVADLDQDGDLDIASIAWIGYQNMFILRNDNGGSGSATTVPSAPVNLTAVNQSNCQVQLNWTDNSVNEDGFKVERKIGANGTYSLVATVGANTASWQNTGIAANTTYYYRVQAYNNIGTSGYSNESSVTTSNCVISVPISAHYEFTDSASAASDSSGSNNTLTLKNGAAYDSLGRIGGSLILDGTDDYAEAANSPSLNITSDKLTISAWVKFDSVDSVSEILIAKPVSASSHNYPYFSYSLHRLPDKTLRFLITTNGTVKYAAGGSVLADTWYHVAGVYDGATVKLYINGQEVSSQSASGNITGYSTPLRLGVNGALGEPLDGRLDNVKIYQGALTPAEVNTDYETLTPAYAESDLNKDAKTDLTDLNILKTDFLKLAASLVNPRSDINQDGQATIRDIGILMSQWKP